MTADPFLGGTSRGGERRRPKIVWAAWAWGLTCGPVVATVLITTQSAWIALLVYQAVCGVLAWHIGIWGSRPTWMALLLVGATTTALVGGAGTVLVPHVEPHLPMTRWRLWGLTPPYDVWLLACFAGLNPWVEEWFWRGGLAGPRARGEFGAAARARMSVVAFWVFHVFVLGAAFTWVAGGLTSFFVLGAAIVWSVLVHRTHSVWWGVASHQGANLGLALVYFMQLRAP